MWTIDRLPATADTANTNTLLLDPTHAEPDEAVVTLLGLTERYGKLLGNGGSAEIDGLLQARSQPGAWSAIDYVAHVAELLHATSKRLLLVFDQPDRELSPPHLEAVSASARIANPRVVLASLRAAAVDLAHVVDEADPAAWRLAAKRGGRRVTAGQLLSEALFEAQHHLDDATAALAAAARAAK